MVVHNDRNVCLFLDLGVSIVVPGTTGIAKKPGVVVYSRAS